MVELSEDPKIEKVVHAGQIVAFNAGSIVPQSKEEHEENANTENNKIILNIVIDF
jgi:hypothetical protein